MALQKCPKCELNYIREGQTLCDVCARTAKRRHAVAQEAEEEQRMCSECGENPAVKGSDLCADCLREQKRQQDLENVILIEDPTDTFSDDEEEEDGE